MGSILEIEEPEHQARVAEVQQKILSSSAVDHCKVHVVRLYGHSAGFHEVFVYVQVYSFGPNYTMIDTADFYYPLIL